MLTKEDYMMLSKERLAELLVEKDRETANVPYYPTSPSIPVYPYPTITYEPPYKVTCTPDTD